jgi:hypothetical protein
LARAIALVGFSSHSWDQEEVDQPADPQQPEGEEPEGACQWAK